MNRIKRLLGKIYIGRSGIILSALVIIFLFYERIYSGYLYGDDDYSVDIVDGETVRQAVADSRGSPDLLQCTLGPRCQR